MNTPKRVLIIDDEPILVETIAYNVEKAGFVTFKAFNGEDGLLLATQNRPHLVILDVMMPKMSGWQVCRTLRADPLHPP